MRLAIGEGDGPVGGAGCPVECRTGSQATIGGERRVAPAPSSASAGASADTSPGSGRIVSETRLPAGSAVASAVLSCARIVVSPRSTVTRLVAPRNVEAITVPVSGPAWPEESDASVTASGRTRAVTDPAGADGSTSGRAPPRAGTAPPLTMPGSPLPRPTNAATNHDVAGAGTSVCGVSRPVRPA